MCVSKIIGIKTSVSRSLILINPNGPNGAFPTFRPLWRGLPKTTAYGRG